MEFCLEAFVEFEGFVAGAMFGAREASGGRGGDKNGREFADRAQEPMAAECMGHRGKEVRSGR